MHVWTPSTAFGTTVAQLIAVPPHYGVRCPQPGNTADEAVLFGCYAVRIIWGAAVPSLVLVKIFPKL